jgi:hypothetical protein
LEALNNLYVDYLKDTKDFWTSKQDDGKLYFVIGIKDGWKIGVNIAVSLGNWVSIDAIPYEEY